MVGAFPSGVPNGQMISQTTMEGPIEKFLAYLVGHATSQAGMYIVYALLALAAYVLLFAWYAKQMKKRNQAYAAAKANQ
jgi:PTS system galactitol-specific IIC component